MLNKKTSFTSLKEIDFSQFHIPKRNRFQPVSANVVFLHHHIRWQNWSFVIVCFVETLLLTNIKAKYNIS